MENVIGDRTHRALESNDGRMTKMFCFVLFQVWATWPTGLSILSSRHFARLMAVVVGGLPGAEVEVAQNFRLSLGIYYHLRLVLSVRERILGSISPLKPRFFDAAIR